MDLGLTPEAIRTGLIFFLLLFASLILRSFAQAWLADRLGDPTPRDEGRVTLYPPPHIDALGTVVFPLICLFFFQPRLGQISFFFAWTNPVPINPAHFANPRRGFLFTQFAGFGMSMVLALLAAIIGGFAIRIDDRVPEIFAGLISINAMLIVLDFLPLPPFPGAALIRHLGLISEDTYWAIARWSWIIVLIAFNLPPVRLFLGFLVAVVQFPFLKLFWFVAAAMS